MGIGPADTFLGGVLLHLLLCGIALSTGCGTLRLFRIRITESAALVAPFMALVFWSLLLGITVTLHVPVRALVPWFWAATAIIAAIGFGPALRVVRAQPRLLIAVMLLPVATMGDCFWRGMASYARMSAHDGWSYVSMGQYLWENPRGTEGGLAAVFQYASGLSDTRFIGPALLGVFSPLVRYGDLQSVMLLFQSLAIYIAASAAASFWLATTERRDFALWAAAAFAVSGWVTNMLIANNFDNLLCLTYMPGIAVLWQLFDRRWFVWSIAAGSAVAAVVYTYPELAPVAVAGAALISLPNIVGDLRRTVSIVGSGSSLFACAALWLIPYYGLLAKYFRNQLGTLDSTAGRPGDGFFEGLVAPAQYPGAFWGLGNEFYRHRWIDNVLGYGLSACLFVGVAALCFRPKLRGVSAAVGLTICGALVMIIGRGYAYGAYKFIALGWWLYAGAALIGFELAFEFIVERFGNPTFRRHAVRVVGVAAVLCLALILVDRRKYCHSARQTMTLAECRKLAEVRALTKGSTVVVDVDDAFAGNWAAYYLRDCDTIFTHYVGYMLGDVRRMDRARNVDPTQARFLLTDHEPDQLPAGTEVAWRSGDYRLWQFADRVPTMVAFTALDGEFPKWKPTLTLVADRGTQVRLLATGAGQARLNLELFAPPTAPANEATTLELTLPDASVHTLTLHRDRNIVDVTVEPGRNDFHLRLLATAATGPTPTAPTTRQLTVAVETVEPNAPRQAAKPAAATERTATGPSNSRPR